MNKKVKKIIQGFLGLILIATTIGACSGSNKSIKPTCNMTEEEMKNMPNNEMEHDGHDMSKSHH